MSYLLVYSDANCRLMSFRDMLLLLVVSCCSFKGPPTVSQQLAGWQRPVVPVRLVLRALRVTVLLSGSAS
jgi:hypothetical protein